jgi:hypothetical protein
MVGCIKSAVAKYKLQVQASSNISHFVNHRQLTVSAATKADLQKALRYVQEMGEMDSHDVQMMTQNV